MTPERRRQVEEIYRAALERAAAADRSAFVAARCAGDVELQRAVEAQLAAADSTQLRQSPTAGTGAIEPGLTIAHYRVDGLLGAGGMGVVYRATDTRLNRNVAIKFLSEALLDANAARRFQREAQIASALNHPHILTVHDVGEYAGSQYLVTEHVDGGTLADWLQAEPRTWRQSAELMIGVADALAAAHAAKILHRDIKPANILVSRAGHAKLADFGLAKLVEAAAQVPSGAFTRTGVVIGTTGYMSPEQLAGRTLDERSDVFAFGVLLYEMLARRQPFAGDTDVDVMHAILHAAPAPLPADLPEALRTIVEKAMEKDPAERYQSMRDLAVDLRRVARRTTAPGVPSGAASAAAEAPRVPALRTRRSLAAATAAAIVAAALGGGYFVWNQAAQARWARAEAIPTIASLTDRGDYHAAFDLAQQAGRYAPDDPLLRSITPLFTATYAVTSTPADANVLVRGYSDADEEWLPLGRTPLPEVHVARRPLRWRIEKDGFEPAEVATGLEDAAFSDNAIAMTLQPLGTEPEMVFVPGGSVAQVVNAVRVDAEIGSFFIDRYEVTNAAYKEFVDAGGYERPGYWEGLDQSDGAQLAWEAAMRLFIDTTGRPGPAAWELGDFPAGQDRHPVTGVSWYEAAAYARFRGKSLATVYHWAKAALPPNNIGGLTASIVPASNFGAAGVAAVGAYQGMGPYGTYDMHGNVSEWTSNRSPTGTAWALGGSWRDPFYNFTAAPALPLLERSPLVGFRLIKDAGTGVPPTLSQAIDLERPKFSSRPPASDETYAAYIEQFAYRAGELNATEPVVVETTDDWTVQRVTVDTGYDERMDIVLFVPTTARPPYQAFVYFPGYDAFVLPASSAALQPGPRPGAQLDFVVKSGRVLVQPIYQGSYERLHERISFADTRLVQRRWVDWRWDMGRTLDYLATRADIDSERIGYVGLSFGASYSLHLLALEPRFRAALLLAGGVGDTFVKLPPPLDPVHYAPRVEIPTLMINGRYDYVNLIESANALFELLGTPARSKRQVLVESGHIVPRNDILRESLGWLDEQFGATR
jgi:eukaryotic-like serine/threonine-protein kinase